jgi:acetoin utilization deacetylase AcuC-like enzyme
MASCVFFSHPASAGHDTGSHPERGERIVAIERHLEQTGWSGFERRDAPRVERTLLETCHDAGYVAALERLCAVGGGQIDEDTLVSSGSFEAAMRAAGGAVAVVDALLSGEAVAAFSAGRPPGHHALRARAGGFCLFNNIAVATLHALGDGGLERVLIFDWDVHHGNGTNELFHSSPAVLYVSIHEAPLFPGSGPASDRGSGAGEGFTLNLPVPAFSGDDVFCELVHERVIPLAREYRPQLIMISAGYDAHAEDPLADCLVSEAGFATMTTAMRRLGEELEAPVGVVLEGGYELGALARSVAATLQALSAGHG